MRKEENAKKKLKYLEEALPLFIAGKPLPKDPTKGGGKGGKGGKGVEV